MAQNRPIIQNDPLKKNTSINPSNIWNLLSLRFGPEGAELIKVKIVCISSSMGQHTYFFQKP